MTNLIAAAVEPLRAQAVQEARGWCAAQIERVTKELAEAGNDLNVYAPYPSLSRPCITVQKMGYEAAGGEVEPGVYDWS